MDMDMDKYKLLCAFSVVIFANLEFNLTLPLFVAIYSIWPEFY